MTYLYLKISYLLSRVFYPSPSLSRGGYWKNSAIDFALVILLFIAIGPTFGSGHETGSGDFRFTIQALNDGLAFFAIVVIVIRGSFSTVRRLHDLGHPGIYYLFIYVPIMNLIILFQLFFSQGASEKKPHGML